MIDFDACTDPWCRTPNGHAAHSGLRVLRPCAICGRRPEEVSVLMDGLVTPVCSTCFERGEDERDYYRGPDAD